MYLGCAFSGCVYAWRARLRRLVVPSPLTTTHPLPQASQLAFAEWFYGQGRPSQVPIGPPGNASSVWGGTHIQAHQPALPGTHRPTWTPLRRQIQAPQPPLLPVAALSPAAGAVALRHHDALGVLQYDLRAVAAVHRALPARIAGALLTVRPLPRLGNGRDTLSSYPHTPYPMPHAPSPIPTYPIPTGITSTSSRTRPASTCWPCSSSSSSSRRS